MAPVCQNKTYTWENLDNAALNTNYLGNASKYDWVYSGFPNVTEDGNLLMTMPKNSVGTLFANNHYIWYGKISGKIKSSRGKGVVTAFILLSDTKDEIDFEFVGADLDNVQTNYYFNGNLDCEFPPYIILFLEEILTNIDNNGGSSKVDKTNTFDDWHSYEINWTPDFITWTVDGDVKRTLEKDSTWNETSQNYEFPQTPSRMQLSLWPAGQASNANGTKEWAGGEIDWDSQDIKDTGYYYANIGEITVECYDPPAGSDIKGDKSYVFKDDKGVNSSVQVTNNKTVLGSSEATGLNLDLGADHKNKSSNSTHSGHKHKNMTGPINHGGSDESGRDQSSRSKDSNKDTTSNGASLQSERVMQGSLFAVLVAVVVLITV